MLRYTLLYHPKGIMSNVQDYIKKYHAGPAVTACSDCRRRFPYAQLTSLDGRLLCDSCIETCDECNQEVPLVLATFHSNDPHKRVFCPTCEALATASRSNYSAEAMQSIRDRIAALRTDLNDLHQFMTRRI